MKNDYSFKLLAAVILSGAILTVIDPVPAVDATDARPVTSVTTATPAATLALVQR